MNTIQGRKIEQVYTLDGQPVGEDIKPIRFLEQPKIKIQTKPKQVQDIEKNKTNEKNNKLNKKETIEKQKISKPIQSLTTRSQKIFATSKKSSQQSPQNKSRATSQHSQINQPQSSPTTKLYREPRKFKPLSEQFPNLVGTLFQPKQFKEDSPYQSSSSLTEEEEIVKEIPKPERNPQVERKVEKLVQENNTKFKEAKDKISLQRESERRQKIEQREKMKQYGKAQIVRAHTQEECFENKFSWGVNQAKQKQDEEKFQKIREEKQQKEQSNNGKIKQKVEMSKLFPESRGRVSKYKKLWEEEAVFNSKKENYSLSYKKKQLSDEKCNHKHEHRPNENPVDIQTVIQQNARIALKEIKRENNKMKIQTEFKKERIQEMEKIAKKILQKTKKKQFEPSRDFNAQNDQNQRIKEIEDIDDLDAVQNLFKTAELDAEDFKESQELAQYQKKIKNGKVMTQREAQAFQAEQEAKKQQINVIKDGLNKTNYITLKNPDQLTDKEQLVKDQMIKQIIDVQKETKQEQRQQNIKQKREPLQVQIQAPEQMIDYILQEAEIPQLKATEYQPNYDTEFRQQVEQEIKEQILKAEKRKKPTQISLTTKPNYQKQKPQPRSQKYRQNKSQQSHPIYHDLGEAQILEEDMYNSMHSKWNPGMTLIDDSESDIEDNKQFIEKSGFFRKPEQLINQNRVVKPVYSKSIQPEPKKPPTKQVKFREPNQQKESNESVNYLTEQKEKLMKIINQQKLKGDTDSDDDQLPINNQIWLPTDPIRRDIFLMSSKELMQLKQVNI
ncbi:hypothetical protein pb186bvf_010287 [Paramecium bursaria]